MNLLLISSFIYISITLSKRKHEYYLIETKDKRHADLHGPHGPKYMGGDVAGRDYGTHHGHQSLQTDVLPIYIGGNGMDYGAHWSGLDCNGVALYCKNREEGHLVKEDSCHFK